MERCKKKKDDLFEKNNDCIFSHRDIPIHFNIKVAGKDSVTLRGSWTVSRGFGLITFLDDDAFLPWTKTSIM